MSFVYEISPNSAQSTQMKISHSLALCLAGWGRLATETYQWLWYRFGLSRQYMTWKNNPVLQRILAWEHFGTCTLVILYDWKMLRRSITQSLPLFACLKLATCQIHQGCLSDLNLPPSVVGGNVWTAPREAEISVNYRHWKWINADTHTWWKTSWALFFCH